ncbi:MAG: DUF3185 domain-containing protein [Acidobacteria bacterium]|nr:DUF3185 domain-containing protein [Acidobacteriota bacterium]
MNRRWVSVLGVVLIILGIAGFLVKAIPFQTEEKVLDIGPIEATAEKEHRLPIPTLLAGLALAGGVVLVIAGARR